MEDQPAFRTVVQDRTIHAAEQDRPDIAARRSAWKAGQTGRESKRLIFIDALWEAMQGVLDRVTATDARNCYRLCGHP